MVKKKLELKEEVKEAVKEEDLVSVEMSEAEKEEFVAFKLAKEKEDEKKKQDEDIVEVELRFQHWVNGHSYLPGKHNMARGTAVDLIRADGRYLRKRMKEIQPEAYMVDIMTRGPGRIRDISKKAEIV